jgi:hypothetical protein
VLGLDPQGRLNLLDLWRRQSAPDEWIEAFCDLAATWKPIGSPRRAGTSHPALARSLKKRMRARRARVYRQPFAARLDKTVRAQSMALDCLYVRGSPTSAPSCSRSHRPPRRPGGCDRADRSAAGQDGAAGESEAGGIATRSVGQA